MTVSPVEIPPKYWKKTAIGPTNMFEGMAAARDIGYLRLNYSRLNLVSQLESGDKENWYKVSVQSSGLLTLAVRHSSQTETGETIEDAASDDALQDMIDSLEASGMRVELIVKGKGTKTTTLASNDKASGAAYEAFSQMIRGQYKLAEKDKGDMYIKVSRLPGADATTKEFYTLQMRVGDGYKHDYVTVEQKQAEDPSQGYVSELDKLLAGAQTGKGAATLLSLQGANQLMAESMSNLAIIQNKQLTAKLPKAFQSNILSNMVNLIA
ncbi:hypothetical protein FACS1894186_6570 [Alphaproteobacteria bacterium]|nr:hypothetical protein FACS1894186_6570 [Alphaproteobacteria bacterium]